MYPYIRDSPDWLISWYEEAMTRGLDLKVRAASLQASIESLADQLVRGGNDPWSRSQGSCFKPASVNRVASMEKFKGEGECCSIAACLGYLLTGFNDVPTDVRRLP